jgi:GAF domain
MGKLPAFLDDVIVTSELSLRPSRPPKYSAEIQTIKTLVNTMSENPDAFWQRLAEAALQLCRAGTAGVSLLDTEDGAEVFRAEAVAGVLSGHLNSTTPRASPCGAAIDRDATQLMYRPERFFSALKFEPPIVEALIIPFRVQNRSVGTVWVLAHDDSCKFDREDERSGRTLASFAAAGWHLRRARRNAEPATDRDRRSMLYGSQTLQEETIRPTHMREELQHLIQRLEVRASEKTADLIADERRIEMPDDVHEEPQPSHLEETATLQGEMGDFNGLLTIIQGYTTMMKTDLDDPTKLKEDIEAISEAASLVKALIDSHQRTGRDQ